MGAKFKRRTLIFTTLTGKIFRSLVEACNERDITKVRKLLDEGRVSIHDTTEEGDSLLSLACSAGYFELAQVHQLSWLRIFVNPGACGRNMFLIMASLSSHPA